MLYPRIFHSSILWLLLLLCLLIKSLLVCLEYLIVKLGGCCLCLRDCLLTITAVAHFFTPPVVTLVRWESGFLLANNELFYEFYRRVIWNILENFQGKFVTNAFLVTLQPFSNKLFWKRTGSGVFPRNFAKNS